MQRKQCITPISLAPSHVEADNAAVFRLTGDGPLLACRATQLSIAGLELAACATD